MLHWNDEIDASGSGVKTYFYLDYTFNLYIF